MQFNIRRCLSGIALVGLGIVLNEAHNTQQFVPETAAGAVIAAGYGASVLAEQLILRRLQARSLSPLPQAPVEPTPIPHPTRAETIVADIGPRIVGIASGAHVTIYSLAQASQGFLQ